MLVAAALPVVPVLLVAALLALLAPSVATTL
jgi:hypothetical protein